MLLVGDSPLYQLEGSWTGKVRLARLGLSRDIPREVVTLVCVWEVKLGGHVLLDRWQSIVSNCRTLDQQSQGCEMEEFLRIREHLQSWMKGCLLGKLVSCLIEAQGAVLALP